MRTAAVFIDGGYLQKIMEHCGKPRIDHARFADWACEPYERFRAYYYHCAPFQSSNPTPEEKSRMESFERFRRALERIPRFTVRLGRLARRDREDGSFYYEQKGVDLQMGLDIASVALLGRVDVVVIVSGDSDLLPAVHYVKDRGLLVCLVHGAKDTYHRDLWVSADERKEITPEVLESLKLEKAAQMDSPATI